MTTETTTDYRTAAALLGLPTATPGQLGRCPIKACPVRFRDGLDKVCRDHTESAAVIAYLQSLDHSADDYDALPASIMASSPNRDRETAPEE